MSNGVPVMWMRGGTSKGGYFLASDLPSEPTLRDEFLLRVMGSPDNRQIDGMGGGNSLTSKVAIVSKSERVGVDIDYLFLQVAVEQAIVSDSQNCGNILAGVAPFAVERGLVKADSDETVVTIHMENANQTVKVILQTPNGKATYTGSSQIDGVPKTAAPIQMEFQDIAGSLCGSLLPTGNSVDVIVDVEMTLIDNGMPCVVMRAKDLGLTGYETPDELNANELLKKKLEEIRLQAGVVMKLGDVEKKSVPKMFMVSPPQQGGTVTTRCFIPHHCHASIGVFGALSVATACLLDGSPAAELAAIPSGNHKQLSIEHPTGATIIAANVDEKGAVSGATILRTARKLMDGLIFAD